RYLTEGEKTRLYMFGCEIISDWEIGSPVIWTGVGPDGQELVFVKGDLLEYKKEELLRLTLFDPNMGLADLPKNYLEMVYRLVPRGKQTQLIMEQSGFEGADQGKQRYEDSLKGWDAVLQQIKDLAEKEAAELS
nr:SRPBCC domain-containing protein [Saprospiraceae bacterium]